MNSPYEDLLHLPHHVSARHPSMPVHDRAAQFAPFAALTGYGTAISGAAEQMEQQVAGGSRDKDGGVGGCFTYYEEEEHIP